MAAVGGLASLAGATAPAPAHAQAQPPPQAQAEETGVRINEVESSGGDPDDWVELANPGAEDEDISGYVIRDDDDSHTWTAPAGTTVPANGYLVVESADLGFGLGGADSVRLFSPDDELLDSYTWPSHAPTTYGRCPDGTGDFAVTTEATKGAPNSCEGDPVPPAAWPGGSEVSPADLPETFDGDLSGLDYEPTGTSALGALWAVDNGRGLLHRLIWNDAAWVPDPSNGWAQGKTLRYPDGTGTTDSEGVTVTGDGSVVVGAERNNADSGVSRMSVLKYDAAGAETTLTAATEWDLTPDLPAAGANVGIEAVEWVPDATLIDLGFVDESTGAPYSPQDYAEHGDGVYFVGIEATGLIYGYVLMDDGGYQRVAEVDPELGGVMGLDYDAETATLWAVCDDGCEGRSSLLQIDEDGTFAVTDQVARPAGMPDLNNEGFVITPVERCVDGMRLVYWADDGDTDDHSIRSGTLNCPDPDEPEPPEETAPPTDDPTPPPGDDTGDGGDDDGSGGDDGSDGSDDGTPDVDPSPTPTGNDEDGGAGGGGDDAGNGTDSGDAPGEDLPDTGAGVSYLAVAGLALALAGLAVVNGRPRRSTSER